MKRTIAALFAAVCVTTAAPAAADEDLETARAFLDAGLYAEALVYLRVAADEGDAEAAEILGFMHAFGEDMFPGVARDAAASARWFEQAARAGRQVGRYMACAIGNGGDTARRCLRIAGRP